MSKQAAELKPEETKPEETKADPLDDMFMAALGFPDIEVDPVIEPLPEDPLEQKPAEEPKPPAVAKTVVVKAVKAAPNLEPTQAPPAARLAPQEAPKISPAPKQEDPPSDLTEEEQELLAVTEFAEEAKLPGFTGKAKELKGYFAKLKIFTEANPDLTENDDEFTRFIQAHQPKISPVSLNKARREQMASELRKEYNANLEQRMQEIRHENLRTQLAPKIEKEVEAMKAELGKAEIGGDTMGSVIAALEANPEEAANRFPIEAPIVSQTIELTRTYLEIHSNSTRFDQANPAHAQLAGFIFGQADKLKAQPASVQLRNGKSFLDPQEFAQLEQKDPANIYRHWTFSRDDVVTMLSANAKRKASSERQRFEAAYLNKAKPTETKEEPKAQKASVPAPPIPPTSSSRKPVNISEADLMISLLAPGMSIPK